MRDRSVKQPRAPKGIDPRTWTRYATEEDRKLAGRALYELEQEHLRVVLTPAPRQNFDGHKIRTVVSENPKWYQEFVAGPAGPGEGNVKRPRVIRALERVHFSGRIRGNGYERELMKRLRDVWSD